jgi:hypothetical protein
VAKSPVNIAKFAFFLLHVTRSVKEQMTTLRAGQFKYAFGSPNPVIAEEEAVMLAEVDKAVRSSGNAQIIGLDFGHSPCNQIAGKWQPAEGFMAGAWEAA